MRFRGVRRLGAALRLHHDCRRSIVPPGQATARYRKFEGVISPQDKQIWLDDSFFRYPHSSCGSRLQRLTVDNLAAFLAAADETFVLSTSSDIASSLGLSKLSSWLLTGYNLGYMMALPLVSDYRLVGFGVMPNFVCSVRPTLRDHGMQKNVDILVRSVWIGLYRDVSTFTVFSVRSNMEQGYGSNGLCRHCRSFHLGLWRFWHDRSHCSYSER